MKVVLNKNTGFKPVDLTITLESQEEFDQVLIMSHYKSTLACCASEIDNLIKTEIIENLLNEIFLAMNNKK